MDARKRGEQASGILLTALPIDELKKNLGWQHVYDCEEDEKRKFDRILMGKRSDLKEYTDKYFRVINYKKKYYLESELRKRAGIWTIFTPNHVQPGYLKSNIPEQEKWEQCCNWNKGYWAAAIQLRKEFWLVSDVDAVMRRQALVKVRCLRKI